MAEEILELSLTPEYQKRIDDIIGIGGRSSLYGPEDPTAAIFPSTSAFSTRWNLPSRPAR